MHTLPIYLHGTLLRHLKLLSLSSSPFAQRYCQLLTVLNTPPKVQLNFGQGTITVRGSSKPVRHAARSMPDDP